MSLPEHRGELSFVVKPTRLSVVRDVAVITVCVVVLAVMLVDCWRACGGGGLSLVRLW